MSNSRFQFGIRGLLVLMLAAASFFGGWAARDRLVYIRGEEVYPMYRPTIDEQVFELGVENEQLREQIGGLNQTVATQQAQLDEINASIGPPEFGKLDLESMQLEVTTAPRGIDVRPTRYDLIDVLDEPLEGDQ